MILRRRHRLSPWVPAGCRICALMIGSCGYWGGCRGSRPLCTPGSTTRGLETRSKKKQTMYTSPRPFLLRSQTTPCEIRNASVLINLENIRLASLTPRQPASFKTVWIGTRGWKWVKVPRQKFKFRFLSLCLIEYLVWQMNGNRHGMGGKMDMQHYLLTYGAQQIGFGYIYYKGNFNVPWHQLRSKMKEF